MKILFSIILLTLACSGEPQQKIEDQKETGRITSVGPSLLTTGGDLVANTSYDTVLVTASRGYKLTFEDGAVVEVGPSIEIGEDTKIIYPIGTDFDSLVAVTMYRIRSSYY